MIHIVNIFTLHSIFQYILDYRINPDLFEFPLIEDDETTDPVDVRGKLDYLLKTCLTKIFRNASAGYESENRFNKMEKSLDEDLIITKNFFFDEFSL